MAEFDTKNKELIGAAPLDVFTHIVAVNPQIAVVNFWTYVYKPVQFAEPGENPHWITREEFLSRDVLPKLIKGLPDDAQLGVFSKVRLNSGGVAHIPMMDFSIPKGDRGIAVVIERLQKAGLHKTWILETGESYHLYGQDLLSEEEWVQFMGTCLLTSVVHQRDDIEQIADPRYIGHSLKRGGNVLRVTTRAIKSFEPKVIAFIP